ncbi:unnamed protein product [Caenorhabditis auriculariae]|uniref:Uncharacterized protein n=1 Tax=Caenorhabditis auriculariae TaxID=2777116 RepID=A0A8S1HKH2_9PELO|nr:unnamed protein product [Caenorhabditis auriculariae]
MKNCKKPPPGAHIESPFYAASPPVIKIPSSDSSSLCRRQPPVITRGIPQTVAARKRRDKKLVPFRWVQPNPTVSFPSENSKETPLE